MLSALQTSPDSKSGIPSIPPPLKIPPSRARRQLARRLAAKKAVAVENADPDAADQAALEATNALPDDAGDLPIDISAADRDVEEAGLQITGLRTVGGAGSASRFSGLFSGSDDSSSSDDDIGFDEDDAGKDETIGRAEGDFEGSDDGFGETSQFRWRRRDSRGRRPSTTEAKERTPLDDDEEDEDAADLGRAFDAKLAIGAEGPFADPIDVNDGSSDEDELVEIRSRRTS